MSWFLSSPVEKYVNKLRAAIEVASKESRLNPESFAQTALIKMTPFLNDAVGKLEKIDSEKLVDNEVRSFKQQIAQLNKSHDELKAYVDKNPHSFSSDKEKVSYLHGQLEKRAYALLDEFEKRLKELDEGKKFFETAYSA